MTINHEGWGTDDVVPGAVKRAGPAGGGPEPGEEARAGSPAGGRAVPRGRGAAPGRPRRRLREVRPARQRSSSRPTPTSSSSRNWSRSSPSSSRRSTPTPTPRRLIDDARAEIDRTRREAREALDLVTREADEARKALRAAIDQYQQLRRELDRLQPQLAESFSAEDRLLWDAETLFPGGQLQSLAREVEAAAPYFGVLAEPSSTPSSRSGSAATASSRPPSPSRREEPRR